MKASLQSNVQKVIWLTLFSVSMGYLESAVVVYLREIYYPEGFDFPLVAMDNRLVITELFRELATIIMLIGAGVVAGTNRTERFAWFIYCFAVWDIFYYVFLKVLLDWPASLFTWDVLFLIPVTWVGPVITPVIISLTMILLTFLIIHFKDKMNNFRLLRREWMLLIAGSLVVIISFVWDYCSFIFGHYGLGEIWSLQSDKLFDLSIQYIPDRFNWWLFWAGEYILLFAIGKVYLRNKGLLRLCF